MNGCGKKAWYLCQRKTGMRSVKCGRAWRVQLTLQMYYSNSRLFWGEKHRSKACSWFFFFVTHKTEILWFLSCIAFLCLKGAILMNVYLTFKRDGANIWKVTVKYPFKSQSDGELAVHSMMCSEGQTSSTPWTQYRLVCLCVGTNVNMCVWLSVCVSVCMCVCVWLCGCLPGKSIFFVIEVPCCSCRR